ncbi:MAG: putative Ig domain-containing protein, partial [Patescibacteria group bacterium]
TTGSFTVTFTNSAPVISSTIADQPFVQNSPIAALTLPVANDANSGDPVTYSVSVLPTGLSFNPSTRQITGTPSVLGTFPITYTATDGSNATDSKSFNIVVSANSAPTISSTPTFAPNKGLNWTQSGLSLAISDTGPLTVVIAVDNGGSVNVTNPSG